MSLFFIHLDVNMQICFTLRNRWNDLHGNEHSRSQPLKDLDEIWIRINLPYSSGCSFVSCAVKLLNKLLLSFVSKWREIIDRHLKKLCNYFIDTTNLQINISQIRIQRVRRTIWSFRRKNWQLLSKFINI